MPTENSSSLKLLIVDDHPWTRIGLRISLLQTGMFSEIAEAENGEEAILLAQQNQPDIVLMDIRMPKMDGIKATNLLKQRFPQIRVIMLTSSQDEQEIVAAMASGANAYCVKDIDIDRLLHVIHMVRNGDIWIDNTIANKMMQCFMPGMQKMEKLEKSIQAVANPILTARETQVLGLIAQGSSNKQIAQMLSIAERTVKVHVSNILLKLAANDRTQAAVRAIQEGLIPS